MTDGRRHGRSPLDRRTFLRAASGGVAAAALAPAGALGCAVPSAGGREDRTGAAAPAGRAGRSGRAPAEPWGRLEAVGDGVWALVSTPLAEGPEARRTLCNGGIVAGRDGLLVVEAFATPEGAAWMAAEAERLAGRRPTHVVLTHYHGDHVGGTAGYRAGVAVEDAPRILATATTRRLVAEQEAALPADRTEARPVLLPDVVLADGGEPVEVDLGGRVVRITPRRGHTPSDVTVAVDDVVFAGDLVWNGMFPNYRDAIPSDLSRHVRLLRDEGARVWVSGHGELAGPADLDRYIDLLDHVADAAREALASGRPLEEAAAEYEVPASLGSWHMFSPRYPEVAFRAFAREAG